MNKLKITLDEHMRQELEHMAFLNDENVEEYAKRLLREALLNPLGYYCVVQCEEPIDFGWDNLGTPQEFMDKGASDYYSEVASLLRFLRKLTKHDKSYAIGGITEEARLLWIPKNGSFRPALAWKVESDGYTYLAASAKLTQELKFLTGNPDDPEYRVFSAKEGLVLEEMLE